MEIVRKVLGPIETNCWIVGDELGGPVVVIDPAGDAEGILESVGRRALGAIVLTHCHFDHLGAVRELVEATGAPFAVHHLDAPFVTSAEASGAALFGFDTSAPAPTRELDDGETIEAGGLVLRVIHTPGHTPGGICLLASDDDGVDHLFSGDTLFAGSVGRTDFPRGDARELSRSIAERLAPLAPSTKVHPGHGPDTTIGRESKINFFWPRRGD
jgi:hydroxyacylglutathione hydrolase